MEIKRLPNRELPPLTIEVGSKIKRAREECGLSQQELARIVGFKTGVAVSLYENNKREVSAIMLWRIARATNVPITFFI